jgi:hypothetical protein
MAVAASEVLAVNYRQLREAVEKLYYAAVWHADRPVDERALWIAVRDAAGFAPGKSPREIGFSGVRVSYDANRIRLLAKLVRKQKGDGEFTSGQAQAFILLHGGELQDRLDATVRDFLKEKL